MKKLIIITIALISCAISVKAQYGYKGAYIGGGYTLQDGGNLYVGYEIPSDNFHLLEVYFHYYEVKYKNKIEDYKAKEQDYSLGIGYKHCVIYEDKFAMHLKLSGEVGTTTHEFIFAGLAGTQFLFKITEDWGIYIGLDGGYYHNSIKNWRVNANGGIRLSF